MSHEQLVVDDRGYYAWQSIEALDKIDTLDSPRRRARAHAVFQALSRQSFTAYDPRQRKGFYAGRKELAALANASTDTFDRGIDDLVALGLVEVIERYDGRGARLANGYRLPRVHSEPPLRSSSNGGSADEGQLVVEEEVLQETHIGASRKEQKVRWRGRPVPEPLVEQAVRHLALCSKRAGRAFAAFTGDGRQTEELTMIVGRIVEATPPLSPEEGDKIVNRVANNPYWEEGGRLPSVGVVFSPKAFTRNRAAYGALPRA